MASINTMSFSERIRFLILRQRRFILEETLKPNRRTVHVFRVMADPTSAWGRKRRYFYARKAFGEWNYWNNEGIFFKGNVLFKNTRLLSSNRERVPDHSAAFIDR